MVDNGIMEVAEAKDVLPSPFYPNKTEIKDWFKDWTTWIFLFKGFLITGGILLVGYLGYNYFNSGLSNTDPGSPTSESTVQPDVTISDRIYNILLSVKRSMNPLNWIRGNNVPIESQEILFQERQSDINSWDTRYYPHTPHSPYDSIWKRIRILIRG